MMICYSYETVSLFINGCEVVVHREMCVVVWWILEHCYKKRDQKDYPILNSFQLCTQIYMDINFRQPCKYWMVMQFAKYYICTWYMA